MVTAKRERNAPQPTLAAGLSRFIAILALFSRVSESAFVIISVGSGASRHSASTLTHETGKQLSVGDPCWIKTASAKPSDTLYKITSVASDGFGCLIAEIKHDGTLYASQPWDTHMLIKNKAAEDAAANMFNKAVLDTFFGKIA